MIYYDIHSHKLSDSENVITVHSLDLGADCKADFAIEHVYKLPQMLFSVGIHPWHPDLSKVEALKTLALSDNVVAIGETGLDKLKNDFELQMQLFEIQIQIAEETRKPLIIHCVRAWNELLEAKKRLKPSVAWIIHGFRGNEKLAEQLLNSGMYLSFGKNFQTESLKKAWKAKRMFAETDDENIEIQDVYDKIEEGLMGCAN